MNAEYPAGEMRARLGFVVSDREPRILTWESGGCHPASIAECALWDAYIECIKAGEAKALGTCPRHGVEYVGECSGCAMTLPEKDFTHPPAQATQVDPAAKPRTLADFVNASDAERAQIGRQVAARVDEMMAGPVAHGEMGKEIEYSLWGLIHNGKVAGDPRQGAVDWHMRTLIRQMVPHLIELAKLKGIRSQFDAATPAQPHVVPDARIVDLAERLVAPGPKAAHISASECHEISEFILSLAAPPIDAPDSKP